MFFPTRPTLMSVPVFTGHLSTQGLVTNSSAIAGNSSGASSRPSAIAAPLICEATAAFTIGNVLTFLKGGPAVTVGVGVGATTSTTGGTTTTGGVTTGEGTVGTGAGTTPTS